MKIKNLLFAAPLLTLAAVSSTYAEPLSIKAGDTMQKQIEAQKGKKVTLRLQTGEEITGTVRTATNELVHLGELSGKEFYDAVVDLTKVSALIVRVK